MSLQRLLEREMCARAGGRFPAKIFIRVLDETEIEIRIAAERAAGRAGPLTKVVPIIRRIVEPARKLALRALNERSDSTDLEARA
jgi:hypothetical protein